MNHTHGDTDMGIKNMKIFRLDANGDHLGVFRAAVIEHINVGWVILGAPFAVGEEIVIILVKAEESDLARPTLHILPT